MIKYLGSKRTLVPTILNVVSLLPDVLSVFDLFSGTSRVGHALKRRGYQVVANDHNTFASTLARCYIQSDAEDVLEDARKLVREFNALKGEPGYFTETFCIKSRFFQPGNGERVDAIREAISRKGLAPELEAVLLTSLMEAADRVDSTTGLQMAFLKKWAARSFNDLELRVPQVLPRAKYGKGQALCLDALEAARLSEADVAYVDPPYNQHSYLANYHIWESLIRWDKPEVYGIACKRIDVRERKSAFNSRLQIVEALQRVLSALRARFLVVSFNNEGYVSREEMEGMLSSLWGGRGKVATIEMDYKRYVGAQIGIYNLDGVKVGRVSHLRNKEYLYVAAHEDVYSFIDYASTVQEKQLSLLGSLYG